MSVIDRIILTLKNKGLMQKELAKYLCEETNLKITQTTISDWKTGKSSTYYQLIPKISKYLGVSCDYLLTGNDSNIKGVITPKTELEELILKLDNTDKTEVKGFVKGLLNANKYKKISNLKIINATYFDTPVSAGTGIQLDYTTMKTIQIIGDEPPKYADYVLRISGNSMEPKFSDGDFIFVQKTDVIEYGDIGIFYLSGDVYMKKYTHDGLESLNHEYDLIPADEEVKCLGKVLRKVRGEVTL